MMMKVRTNGSTSSSSATTSVILWFIILLLLSVVTQPLFNNSSNTVITSTEVHAFGNFVIPKNIFGGGMNNNNNKKETLKIVEQRSSIEIQKFELFQAITGTNNGKTATSSQQIQILQFVNDIEMTQPNISITDPNIVTLLNGTWYLQYTSPSQTTTTTTTTTNATTPAMEQTDKTTPTDSSVRQEQQQQQQQQSSSWWTPKNAALENVETQSFNARGTVSAAGITLDTSNKLVQQIFNVQQQTVLNQINFSTNRDSSSSSSSSSTNTKNNNSNNSNNFYAIAGGTYRPSLIQPNRAIVAFDTAQITIPIMNGQNDLTIQLGWFFTLLSFFRKDRNRDNGWLETTYLDETLRIGRGNKGTMFILTREPLSLS